MIGSLLVANRGEIAVRVMRTCRRLGIRAIAVYSDADRDARHVAFADEAVRIGPAPARESYLRPEAIMEAAARTGAEAIHPGYGFLSEKPDLLRLCVEAGRVFVGPSAECIAAMGPKIGSKLIAARAGVPSVPGYLGGDQSTARLTEEARRVGFPLMVKASAGGGGKGMRRVFAASELGGALDLARREAEAAFGDPALLIEKLVLRPRHLEVQIAGDKHGNVVHLFERDCSVQRNNQKVLEEAPAPSSSFSKRARTIPGSWR
jgi:3-methylcrotonyl-CoA carboxylase alpha subunit